MVCFIFSAHLIFFYYVCLTDVDDHTLIDWRNFLREICLRALNSAPPLGGLGATCCIDKSLLRGKRKYNRGRILLGNRVAPARRNYGNHVVGPWIFEIPSRIANDAIDLRMFHVLRKDERTLKAKFLQHVRPGKYFMFERVRYFDFLGTHVCSDEWAAYRNLRNWGGAGRFFHDTVNHTQAFVNPINGAHTQLIETIWGHVKTKILRNMHGTREHLIPGHLAEFWWRGQHKKTPFRDIIAEIARQFSLVQ